MEYVQERIATLHDYGDATPAAPTDRAAVVAPMTEREYGAWATERTLSALASVDPARVIVPLRAAPESAAEFEAWLAEFDLPLEVLWCSGERLGDLLDAHGLDGDAGKGRDVWLALGLAAAEHPYVVCHDADVRSYEAADVSRLLAPLAWGFTFSKGYYARVENDRLYGRLCRLLYRPLVRTLADRHDAPILDYLGAFRYALAGEFATTAAVARALRVERRFGLEVGTLGDAFDRAGVEGTAQVDLGHYEHDHRAVSGPAGLADMSEDVAAAVLRVVEERGVEPDYETLPAAFRETAAALIHGYEADARFNDLTYEPAQEREQVEQYAAAVHPPDEDDRLPAWATVDLDPEAVLDAARADLRAVR
jgi:glucosyl-3-phosphoglycerate synthase